MHLIVTQINKLAESIRKTFTAEGSNSPAAARDVCEYVKQNKDKVPGMNVTASEMGRFFKKAGNRKKEGTGK